MTLRAAEGRSKDAHRVGWCLGHRCVMLLFASLCQWAFPLCVQKRLRSAKGLGGPAPSWAGSGSCWGCRSPEGSGQAQPSVPPSCGLCPSMDARMETDVHAPPISLMLLCSTAGLGWRHCLGCRHGQCWTGGCVGRSGGIERWPREQCHHGKKEQSFKLVECGDPIMSSLSECVLNPTQLFS